MDSQRFAIIIQPLGDGDGSGFPATTPDLPGCMWRGAPDVEALENTHDAIAAWIEQATAMGRAIPMPTRQRIDA